MPLMLFLEIRKIWRQSEVLELVVEVKKVNETYCI